VELGRALRRGAAATDTGDARFPVSGFIVELAARRTTFGNGGPGFLCARDMRHETSLRKRHLTCLLSLAFRHAKTARQFRRRTWVLHRLCAQLGGGETKYGQKCQKSRGRGQSSDHDVGDASTVSRLAAT